MKILIDNLNDIKVGDRISDNVTKKPFLVVGVSQNYVLAVNTFFGVHYYTIYAKEPEAIYHDGHGGHWHTRGNKFFFRGPDNMLFGGFDVNENSPEEYLRQLEDENDDLNISFKRRRSIEEIYKHIKKGNNNNDAN